MSTPCPSCGYCPHCGRSGYQTNGYWPYYPYQYPYTYPYPYYYSPNITYSTPVTPCGATTMEINGLGSVNTTGGSSWGITNYTP